MKIAVINFSGNVGKSTIAKHVLLPKMKSAKYFEVETVNANENNDSAETFKGKEFAELADSLPLITSDVVVDIGASNIEAVLKFFNTSKGSLEDFDIFVIPVVPVRKQLRDTLSTIDALSGLGVPAKKLRIVFNQIEADDSPRKACGEIFSYHEEMKNFTLNEAATIHANEIFTRIAATGKTIPELAADKTDYKAKIAAAQSQDEKIEAAQMLAVKRLADGISEEIDTVFKILTK